MDDIFVVEDKFGKKIHLSEKQWTHINEDHPEVAPYLEEIKETLKKPTKVVQPSYDAKIRYFYKYFKKAPEPYLLAIVKYLNGEGFIITAYFVRNIK